MNPWRLCGILLVAFVISIAAPRPSAGQFVFTLQQYLVLQERTDAFCNYQAEQTKGGKTVPKGALTFPGIGNGKWVFSASEVEAFRTRCDRLMALMQQIK